MRYDAIIVGLGVAGAAATWRLARQGVRVLALDQFASPHALGSSHGRSRIIREAYFEHPLYVPLVRRAYDGWAELEALTGELLLTQTGGLMLGSRSGTLIVGALASARAHNVAHEVLEPAEIHARFPALHAAAGEVGVLEERAGVLHAERCLAALLSAGLSAGARIVSGARAIGWKADTGGVEVTTADGARFAADRLLLAAGPWLAGLLPDLMLPLVVERQTVHWFEPTVGAAVRPSEMPIVMHEYAADRYAYSFPDDGTGIKAALHHEGDVTTAVDAERHVRPEETQRVRDRLDAFMPGAAGRLVDTSVCLYTNTPDGHFILDTHPAHANVVVLSACSGHGFKFAPSMGELAAQMMMSGQVDFDLAAFRISRFEPR
jgi:sarcosine oxidase